MKNNKVKPAKTWQPSKKMLSALHLSKAGLMGSDDEFARAFKILDMYPKRVTFFGSARDNERDEPYRQAATAIASMLAKDGYAIVSGGGHGIMAASNKGAYEAGGSSIGFNIKLPHEQKLNPYTTHNLAFHYFFTRKVMMTFFSHAYIYFPGGYGTLDELFEVMTMIQTKKMPPLRVILYGSDYWNGLDEFIKRHMLDTGLISPGDENIYHITDDINEAFRLITDANHN